MNLTMIEAAAARLAGHARLTPLLNAPLLDAVAGRRVFVKAECLQLTGSFKFRGGWSAISALPPDLRAKGGAGLFLGQPCPWAWPSPPSAMAPRRSSSCPQTRPR